MSCSWTRPRMQWQHSRFYIPRTRIVFAQCCGGLCYYEKYEHRTQLWLIAHSVYLKLQYPFMSLTEPTKVRKHRLLFGQLHPYRGISREMILVLLTPVDGLVSLILGKWQHLARWYRLSLGPRSIPKCWEFWQQSSSFQGNPNHSYSRWEGISWLQGAARPGWGSSSSGCLHDYCLSFLMLH